MPVWLLTNTCYGNWLPGDPRGSVSSVHDRREDDPQASSRLVHNQPATPVEPSRPGLYRSALSRLKCDPIRLTHEHAEIIQAQLQETCRFRGWRLLAGAVMWNHLHLVIECGDSDPHKVLSDLKAYASRALNRRFGKPLSETWWTMGGSKRALLDEAAVQAAILYVIEKQPHPLIVWRET